MNKMINPVTASRQLQDFFYIFFAYNVYLFSNSLYKLCKQHTGDEIMSQGKNRASWRMGFAYAGIIVGAGFSTGQEVLQFFASHGLVSILGIILAALILMFVGRQAAKLGFRLNAESHETPLRVLFGAKLGLVIDYVLIFFLYGIAVVMIAGSGATFNQAFGIHPQLGVLILILLTFGTLLLDFDKIVNIIGGITPLLIIAVVIITGYNILNPYVPYSEVNNYVEPSRTPSSFWWFDAITYAGLALATAFSFLSIMGSEAQRHAIARRGAIYGGLIIMLLMLLVNVGVLSIMPTANEVPLPAMEMADNMAPWLGAVYSIIIILLIYNSVVGLMYPFLTRFTTAYSGKYKIMLVVSLIAAFIIANVGFVELVNIVYPILGYIGLAISLSLFIRWIMNKNTKKNCFR